VKEAIILAGGLSYRLKPYILIPKPMLSLGKFTLLEYQILWLIKQGFKHIVIASDKDYPISFMPNTISIEYSIEEQRLGTGGALLRAYDWIIEDIAYVMNVDDIVRYNVHDLFTLSEDKYSCILLSKLPVSYGLVRLRDNFIIRFQEKPYLKYWVSCGHYIFPRWIVKDYFPIKGDFEQTILPLLAEDRLLKGMKYRGRWETINTYKEYLRVKKLIEMGELRI